MELIYIMYAIISEQPLVDRTIIIKCSQQNRPTYNFGKSIGSEGSGLSDIEKLNPLAIPVLEIAAGHWPFFDQFQHLANQNGFWWTKFSVHFLIFKKKKRPTNF